MPRSPSEIEAAIRDCVEQCRDNPIVRQCVFVYVRRLMDNDGWSAEDAGKVWQQSIQQLDSSASDKSV